MSTLHLHKLVSLMKAEFCRGNIISNGLLVKIFIISFLASYIFLGCKFLHAGLLASHLGNQLSSLFFVLIMKSQSLLIF